MDVVLMDILKQTDVIPLYQQLKNIIKDAILSGKIKANEKIPSEAELSKTYQVSRITVRNAIGELVEEGFLIKKQGKGTFANKPKLEKNIIEFLSFTLTCEVNGIRPGSKLIKKEVIQPTQEDVEKLRLSAGNKVVFIQRVRYADHEPLILENNYFSDKYEFLMDEDLEKNSLYKILRNKYNVDLASCKKTIEISIASTEEMNLLGVSKGYPMLLVEDIVFDHEGFPVHRAEQFIVGDKIKLTIN